MGPLNLFYQLLHSYIAKLLTFRYVILFYFSVTRLLVFVIISLYCTKVNNIYLLQKVITVDSIEHYVKDFKLSADLLYSPVYLNDLPFAMQTA